MTQVYVPMERERKGGEVKERGVEGEGKERGRGRWRDEGGSWKREKFNVKWKCIQVGQKGHKHFPIIWMSVLFCTISATNM